MATITPYNDWWVHVLKDGNCDLDGASKYKVSLHTSAYTFSAAHDFFDDLTNEVTGTNYTAGGNSLSSVTVTESGGTTTTDAADTTWSQSGGGFSNARNAILRFNTGSAATSYLQGRIDFTGDKGNVTGDLTIQWNASGIFTIA